MPNLIAAAVVFVLIHRLISGGPGRPLLVRLIGEKPYRAAFALLSLGTFAWLVTAYALVHPLGAGRPAWSSMAEVRIALGLLQLLAVTLILTGLMAPNPTIAGMGDRVGDRDIVRGMLRITRHPFLWGLALFSIGHLAVRRDPASWVMFGTIAFVAIVGTFSIDAKRRAAHGEAWQAFESQTSSLPFAAILSGRQRLDLAEIGPARLIASFVAWGALVWAHPYLAGGVSLLR